MTRIRIIGIGSPLGMDQIGWLITSELSKRHFSAGFPPDTVSIFTHSTPASAALEVEGAALVLVVDAVRGEVTPNRIYRLSLDELASMDSCLSSHGLGLKEMLGILPGPQAPVTIFGIGVDAKDLDGSGLTRVDDLTDRLIPMLETEIQTFMTDRESNEAGSG